MLQRLSQKRIQNEVACKVTSFFWYKDACDAFEESSFSLTSELTRYISRDLCSVQYVLASIIKYESRVVKDDSQFVKFTTWGNSEWLIEVELDVHVCLGVLSDLPSKIFFEWLIEFLFVN